MVRGLRARWRGDGDRCPRLGELLVGRLGAVQPRSSVGTIGNAVFSSGTDELTIGGFGNTGADGIGVHLHERAGQYEFTLGFDSVSGAWGPGSDLEIEIHLVVNVPDGEGSTLPGCCNWMYSNGQTGCAHLTLGECTAVHGSWSNGTSCNGWWCEHLWDRDPTLDPGWWSFSLHAGGAADGTLLWADFAGIGATGSDIVATLGGQVIGTFGNASGGVFVPSGQMPGGVAADATAFTLAWSGGTAVELVIAGEVVMADSVVIAATDPTTAPSLVTAMRVLGSGVGPFAIVEPVDASEPCPGDVDGDGEVGFLDLLSLLAAWGPCADGAPCAADLDGDGQVAFGDLLGLPAAWGPCP